MPYLVPWLCAWSSANVYECAGVRERCSIYACQDIGYHIWADNLSAFIAIKWARFKYSKMIRFRTNSRANS